MPGYLFWHSCIQSHAMWDFEPWTGMIADYDCGLLDACVYTQSLLWNWDLNNLFPNYVEMFYCSGYSQYFSLKFFFVVEFFRCTSVKVLRFEHLSPLWGSLLKIKSVGVRIEVYTDLHRGHPCLSQKKRPMSHPSFFLHLDGRNKALCRVRTQVQRMQRDIRTSF